VLEHPELSAGANSIEKGALSTGHLERLQIDCLKDIYCKPANLTDTAEKTSSVLQPLILVADRNAPGPDHGNDPHDENHPCHPEYPKDPHDENHTPWPAPPPSTKC
jgi:hypothetical protein